MSSGPGPAYGADFVAPQGLYTIDAQGRITGIELPGKTGGGSSTITWRRQADGSVIAQIVQVESGVAPNESSILELSSQEPDAGPTAYTAVIAQTILNGVTQNKVILENWADAVAGGQGSAFVEGSNANIGITNSADIPFTSGVTDIVSCNVTVARSRLCLVCFGGGRFTNNTGANQNPFWSIYQAGVRDIFLGIQKSFWALYYPGTFTSATGTTAQCIPSCCALINTPNHLAGDVITISLRETNGAGDGSNSSFFRGDAGLPLYIGAVPL